MVRVSPRRPPRGTAWQSDTAKAQRDKAKASAYLLIQSIQSLLIENPDMLRILQRLPELPLEDWDPSAPDSWPLSIVELLLAIGVYSDRRALVSSRAFHLVSLIAYGYGAFPDLVDSEAEEPIESEPVFGKPTYTRLIRLYSQDIRFTFPPTNQMRAAFPIFWNCSYPDISWSGVIPQPNPSIAFDLLDLNGNPTGEKWETPRVATATPLEIFGHYILYDPARFDSFNLMVLGILMWYHNYCHGLRTAESSDTRSYVESQKKIYEADLPILRFLERKFEWRQQTDMSALTDAFPMDPVHPHYIEIEKHKRRAVLNGAIVEFANFFLRSEFFTDSTGITLMGERAARFTDDFVFTGRPYWSALNAYKKTGELQGVRLGARSDKPAQRGPLTDRAEEQPDQDSAFVQGLVAPLLRTLHR
jgi:hypothetical protein